MTRVAPWSTWTREQVRAPGGEPALVTRLTQGQLWFSAGRRRSPWRHEVHVGPAIVSTPRGRFQAVAEADGGATISCLAGRTRVVAGLREPVLLGPDQSAAVSSDGRTLVVMDRASSGVETPPDVIDLTDGADDLVEEESIEVAELAVVGAGEPSTARPPVEPLGPVLADEPVDDVAAPAAATAADDDVDLGPRRARLGWVPELVAVAALIVLLVAIVWVFVDGGDTEESVAPATSTPEAVEDVVTTTEADTEIGTPATTEVVTTSAPTTAPATVPTTTQPPLAAGASAVGALRSCRRAEGGVAATVTVTHRGGPPSSFDVTASLVDDAGASFAEGTERSPLLQPGTSADVEVLVPFEGRPEGSCELVSVAGG